MALDGIYLSLLRKEFDPLIDGRDTPAFTRGAYNDYPH